MSLWNYEIFDLIVTTGNLRKAAEIMHLTPSAVSHSLMKLEKEFGLPLLIRDRNGIELTEYGKEILPHIRTILNMDRKLREEVNSISGRLRGSVRIGAFNSICCTWIPHLVRQMQTEYPDVEISIMQNGYEALERGLLEGVLDLVFVSIPPKYNLSAIPLMKDRLLCITPLDFVPENKEYITLKEIRQSNIITPGTGSDFDAIAFMKENHLELKTSHNIIDDSSIIALVESGLGISIIPELVLERLRGRVGVYPIESAPYRTIGIAAQKNMFVSSATDAMLKMILNYVHNRYPQDAPYFRKQHGKETTEDALK